MANIKISMHISKYKPYLQDMWRWYTSTDFMSNESYKMDRRGVLRPKKNKLFKSFNIHFDSPYIAY